MADYFTSVNAEILQWPDAQYLITLAVAVFIYSNLIAFGRLPKNMLPRIRHRNNTTALRYCFAAQKILFVTKASPVPHSGLIKETQHQNFL